MNALILAAGFGTRLMPLTASRPKALVEIDGKPMLQIAIENLIRFGFTRIVINVHHFAPMMVQYIDEHKFDAEILISNESQQLMDTGGAIAHARNFLDVGEPFLVHNVDILSDIDLRKMYVEHQMSGALATLAVSKRQSRRCLLFDTAMNLRGWKNKTTGEVIIPSPKTEQLAEYAFSGIHIISPAIFGMINGNRPFSMVTKYLELSACQMITGHNFPLNRVLDVGRIDALEQAQTFFRQ